MVLTIDETFNIGENCPMEAAGWPNLMIHNRISGGYYPEHTGSLSIKCAFNGEEIYEVGSNRYSVDRNSYLILNAGQRYASHIAPNLETDTFTVFFSPNFAERILRDMVTPEDRLLDDPVGGVEQPVAFLEQSYSHGDPLSSLLREVRNVTGTGPVSDLWLDDHYRLLVELMLVTHRNTREEISKLPMIRRSTRTEIYRRLHRAKDFINASYSEPIMLAHIADAAYLSPHHFLRAFKRVFGVTPHRYLTQRRMERARLLLTETDRSVTEICMDVGFSSLGSFSRIFRSHVGLSPEQFRNAENQRRRVAVAPQWKL